MDLHKARNRLFVFWLACFFGYALLLCAAPILHPYPPVLWAGTFETLFGVGALLAPILVAFPDQLNAKANVNRDKNVAIEDWNLALYSSISYAAFLAIGIILVVYVIQYREVETYSESFQHHFAWLLRFAVLLLPLAEAPAVWILGLKQLRPEPNEDRGGRDVETE